MDAQSRRHYRTALKQAEVQLAEHEKSGEALRSTVDALKQLLGVGAARKPVAKKKRKKRATGRRPGRKRAGAGHPDVPTDAFLGMGPSSAYRKFVAQYGDGYTVPQIRDALVQGGVKSATDSSLLSGIHSVRRRDRVKAQAAAKRGPNSGGD